MTTSRQREKMISGRAKIAGVMGWPIGHTLSPKVHGYWLHQYGVDGVYIPLAVDPARLEQALGALPVLGFRGCNLTIPHKELAVKIVDRIDPLAQRVGAVNTIVVDEDGRLSGKNTDVYGFQENLMAAGFQPLSGSKTAAVLGAGGAARAIIVALQEFGYSEIRLVNRSTKRAEQCAKDLSEGGTLKIFSWENVTQATKNVEVLVNATPLGMKGQPVLDIDLSNLSPQTWVTDIVYTPRLTDFLLQAKKKGQPIVDGLGMLLHQARPGFFAWFGVDPKVTDSLRRFVLDDT